MSVKEYLIALGVLLNTNVVGVKWNSNAFQEIIRDHFIPAVMYINMIGVSLKIA